MPGGPAVPGKLGAAAVLAHPIEELTSSTPSKARTDILFTPRATLPGAPQLDKRGIAAMSSSSATSGRI